MTLRTVIRAASVAACLSGCGSTDDGARPQAPPEPDSGAASSASCPDLPSPFVPGAVASSIEGTLRVQLVDAAPSPPGIFRNEWTIAVQNTDGAAAEGAQVAALQTFMPVHGHPGLPDAEAEPLDDSGRGRLILYFTMRGPWEVRLEVESAIQEREHFVLEVCVQE